MACPNELHLVTLSADGQLVVDAKSSELRRAMPFLALDGARFESDIVDLAPPAPCSADVPGPVIDVKLERQRRRDGHGHVVAQFFLRAPALGVNLVLSEETDAPPLDCEGWSAAHAPFATVRCISQDSSFGYTLRTQGNLMTVEESISDSDTKNVSWLLFGLHLPCGARPRARSFQARDPGWQPNGVVEHCQTRCPPGFNQDCEQRCLVEHVDGAGKLSDAGELCVASCEEKRSECECIHTR